MNAAVAPILAKIGWRPFHDPDRPRVGVVWASAQVAGARAPSRHEANERSSLDGCTVRRSGRDRDLEVVNARAHRSHRDEAHGLLDRQLGDRQIRRDVKRRAGLWGQREPKIMEIDGTGIGEDEPTLSLAALEVAGVYTDLTGGWLTNLARRRLDSSRCRRQ
jgi:hypothetical protein